MNNIRIGNNVTLVWRITRKGVPEILDGKNVEVYILDHNGRKCTASYTISGNEVTLLFLGKDQKELGSHSLVLIENKGGQAQSVVDKINAFSLVPRTYQERAKTGMEDLTSDLALPDYGMSAYEIAVSRGFDGDEDAWLASLKGDPFVYDDFTPEQIQELQRPATVAAALANTAADRANRSASEADSATAAAKAATGQANVAATNANGAATQARNAAGTAETATTNANNAASQATRSAGSANQAATDANAAAQSANTAASQARAAKEEVDELRDGLVTVGSEAVPNEPSDAFPYVEYAPQRLTEAQKRQARENIGAGNATEINNLLQQADGLDETVQAAQAALESATTQAANLNAIKNEITSGVSSANAAATAANASAQAVRTILESISASDNIPAATVAKVTEMDGKVTELEGKVDELENRPSGGGTIDSETVAEDAPSVAFPYLEYVPQALTESQKEQVKKNLGITGGGESYDDSELRGRIVAIEGKESGWNGKYEKPSNGIPEADLSEDVKAKLNSSGGGTATPVVDGLNSTSTTSALSANQGRVLKEIADNKADKATTLEGYGITDAKITANTLGMFVQLGNINAKIPSKTSDLTNDSGFLTEHQDISGKADKTYVDTELGKKQGTITDLATIRSGASAGATAVQPSAISDMETKTHASQTYQPKGSYATSAELKTVSDKVNELYDDYSTALNLI